MSEELLNNKELQEHLNALQPENMTEDEEQQPLGRFGRMAMEHLHSSNPQRFSLLKMQGELMSLMYKVEAEAWEQMEKITQKLLEQNPTPETEDILEKTRHHNQYKLIAEEIVIREVVLAAR